MKRIYAPGMDTNRAENLAAGSNDADISALPERCQEKASIVDRLMDVPVVSDGASVSPEWDDAMARRLQGKLADAMRGMIENPPERRSA